MKTRGRSILIIGILLCLLVAGVVLAAPLAASLERHVTSGGGGHSEAGIYSLDATLGQPSAGLESAASYELCSGYWCGQNIEFLYLPVIVR